MKTLSIFCFSVLFSSMGVSSQPSSDQINFCCTTGEFRLNTDSVSELYKYIEKSPSYVKNSKLVYEYSFYGGENSVISHRFSLDVTKRIEYIVDTDCELSPNEMWVEFK